MSSKCVGIMVVASVVPIRLVGTAVPASVVGTMFLKIVVPTRFVETAVPTTIVETAYYWKSCGWDREPQATDRQCEGVGMAERAINTTKYDMSFH